MFEESIENHIRECLVGDAQKHASDFVAYLRAQGMLFERGAGYWADKRYWMIGTQGKYVCFMLINGQGALRHPDEPEGWIVWSDDSGEDRFADAPLDERMKETAWKHLDFCGHCGGVCDGGTRRIVFGKAFDQICRTAFRFDNPGAEEIACMKELARLSAFNIAREAAQAIKGFQ